MSQYHHQILVEDDAVRICRAPGVPDVLWSATFAEHVPMAGMVGRLRRVGMVVAVATPSMWELQVVGPDGHTSFAQILVLGSARLAMIRIAERVPDEERRAIAGRIADTLRLVAGTFRRRSYRVRRSDFPVAS